MVRACRPDTIFDHCFHFVARLGKALQDVVRTVRTSNLTPWSTSGATYINALRLKEPFVDLGHSGV